MGGGVNCPASSGELVFPFFRRWDAGVLFSEKAVAGFGVFLVASALVESFGAIGRCSLFWCVCRALKRRAGDAKSTRPGPIGSRRSGGV